MTVAELIAKLQTMPSDAIVILNHPIEYLKFDDNDVRLILKDDQKIIKRDGSYMGWHPKLKKPGEPEPEFVTICLLG